MSNNSYENSTASSLLRMSVLAQESSRASYTVSNIFNRFKKSLELDQLKSYKKESLRIIDGQDRCFDFDALYLQEIKTVDYFYRKYKHNEDLNEMLEFYEVKNLCMLIDKYKKFIEQNEEEYNGWLKMKEKLSYLEGQGL